MLLQRLILTFLNLTSSFLSFGAYTYLFRGFGASSTLDGIFLASSLPMTVAGLLNGVFFYLLPIRFTSISKRFQTSSTRTIIYFIISLCLLYIPLFQILKDKFILEGNLIYVFIYILISLLSIISNLFLCITQARGRYLLLGYIALFNSLGLALGILVALFFQIKILFPLGHLLGFLISNIFLSKTLSINPKIKEKDRLDTYAVLKPLKPFIFYIICGTMGFTLFQFIDALLSQFLKEGSLSILVLCQRFVVATAAILSLGAHYIAARTAVLSHKEGGNKALKKLANKEVFRIIMFNILVIFLYYLGANRVLYLLLNSSSMSYQDILRLDQCLGIMLIGTGPMSCLPYLFRIFYAVKNFRITAILGIFVPLAYLAISSILIPIFEINAMAIAYSTSWIIALFMAINQVDKIEKFS